MKNAVTEMVQNKTGIVYKPFIVEEPEMELDLKDLLSRDPNSERTAIAAARLAKAIAQRLLYASNKIQAEKFFKHLKDPISNRPPKPPKKSDYGDLEWYMRNIDALFIAWSWNFVKQSLIDSRSERHSRIQGNDLHKRLESWRFITNEQIQHALVEWLERIIPKFTDSQKRLFQDALYCNGITPEPGPNQDKDQRANIDLYLAGKESKLYAKHVRKGYMTAMEINAHLFERAFSPGSIASSLNSKEKIKLVRKHSFASAILAYLPTAIIGSLVDDFYLKQQGAILETGSTPILNYELLDAFFTDFQSKHEGIDLDNLEYLFKIFKMTKIGGCPALPSALRPANNLFCDEIALLLENDSPT